MARLLQTGALVQSKSIAGVISASSNYYDFSSKEQFYCYTWKKCGDRIFTVDEKKTVRVIHITFNLTCFGLFQKNEGFFSLDQFKKI